MTGMPHKSMAPENDRSLLQNIVSFMGSFAKETGDFNQ